MRLVNSFSFIAAAAVVLLSGSALALSTTHSFSNFSFLGSGGNVVGNTIDGLAIGDTFEVAIALANTVSDGILSVFTHLTYDNSVINIVNGFADDLGPPPEAGFPQSTFVTVLGAPEDAVGQPAGTSIGLALGVLTPFLGDRYYGSRINTIGAIAIFQVVGLGTTNINHVETGYTVLEDRANGTNQALTFSAPLLIVVPEPGIALLMGLGFGGLALSGRRRA